MKTSHLGSGLHLFLRELIRNPRSVGAALPSSKSLSNCIAKQISMENKAYIVELGPGTGVITEALIKDGINPSQLLLIEQSAILCDYLRKQFPSCEIIEGDASHLISLLGDKANEVDTIISSLPLRSLNTKILLAITHEIETLLKPHDQFIQYTYRFWDTRFQFSKYFRLERSYYVWRNFPPARVDVYQRMDSF